LLVAPRTRGRWPPEWPPSLLLKFKLTALFLNPPSPTPPTRIENSKSTILIPHLNAHLLRSIPVIWLNQPSTYLPNTPLDPLHLPTAQTPAPLLPWSFAARAERNLLVRRTSSSQPVCCTGLLHHAITATVSTPTFHSLRSSPSLDQTHPKSTR